jgi:hypothetical protein
MCFSFKLGEKVNWIGFNGFPKQVGGLVIFSYNKPLAALQCWLQIIARGHF